MKSFKRYGFLVVGLVFGLSALAPQTAHAQATSLSIESIGSQIGLGNADLKQAVINILQLVLGFLALITVVMVIIGGFTWMTAAGNEEKVDRAKKTISAAIIGMIIVILAWALVLFVTNTTANVTHV